jgi:hypothetical protein
MRIVDSTQRSIAHPTVGVAAPTEVQAAVSATAAISARLYLVEVQLQGSASVAQSAGGEIAAFVDASRQAAVALMHRYLGVPNPWRCLIVGVEAVAGLEAEGLHMESHAVLLAEVASVVVGRNYAVGRIALSCNRDGAELARADFTLRCVPPRIYRQISNECEAGPAGAVDDSVFVLDAPRASASPDARQLSLILSVAMRSARTLGFTPTSIDVVFDAVPQSGIQAEARISVSRTRDGHSVGRAVICQGGNTICDATLGGRALVPPVVPSGSRARRPPIGRASTTGRLAGPSLAVCAGKWWSLPRPRRESD